MTFPVDLQADALLRTLVAQNGGDLRAAFAILCASVTVEDLTGESFDQALARAVDALFRRPGLRSHGIPQFGSRAERALDPSAVANDA